MPARPDALVPQSLPLGRLPGVQYGAASTLPPPADSLQTLPSLLKPGGSLILN